MLLIDAKAFGVTSMAAEICSVLNRQSQAGSLLGLLNCLLRALHLAPFSAAFFILGLSKNVDALELSSLIQRRRQGFFKFFFIHLAKSGSHLSA